MNFSRREMLKTLGVMALLRSTDCCIDAAQTTHARVFPAPAGVELSKAFAVTVDGESSPVYIAKVAPGDDARRFGAMDKIDQEIFDEASFTIFDMRGPVEVIINC